MVGGGHAARYTKRERIREHLLDLVEKSAIGDAIPSERQLSAELGVSRPTLRGAVDDLVRDGVLVRRHGQGVFVATPKVVQQLAQAGTSSHIHAGVDGVWSSRTIEFAVLPAGPRVARRLRMAPADSTVRATRLRMVDGQPMSVDTLYLPERLVPGLTARDLELHSFYELLESRYGVKLSQAEQTIEPTVVDEDEAALLGVAAYSPALLFERATEDESGQIVEFAHCVYRGDRYRIVSRLSLSADNGRGRVLSGQWSAATSVSGVHTLPAGPFPTNVPTRAHRQI
ncbi:MAG TPA: GntR family transcriptional regulator [Pseudonocardiaceae bacterium]